MIITPNFCVHCRHFTPSDMGDSLGLCRLSPIIDSDYLVTGIPGREFRFASTQREPTGECGQEGKLFEPIEKP